MDAEELADARRDWGMALKADGLEPSFVDRAMAVAPEDVWYPTQAELLAANVVTNLADAATFAMSGYGSDVSIPELAPKIGAVPTASSEP